MALRVLLLACLGFTVLIGNIGAQTSDSLYTLTGIVYDESYRPLSATHVINMDSHEGDVTDSLGMFSLMVSPTDTLLVRNIAYRDTLLSAGQMAANQYVRLKRRIYQLQEARIFEWGSTYGDFRNAVIGMPKQQTLGESMGLPRQDPDYVPLEMDPEAIRSPALLIKSPLTYFYYNFSKEAKSARKVFWLNKNRHQIEQFERIIGGENLASITGLAGTELMEFQAFLYEKMECDFNCTEFQIYSEIHAMWDLYRKAEE